jgi:hypothetical protein
MPTINFRLGSLTTNWDGSNTDPSAAGSQTVLGGLENQARRNVNGGQLGPSLNGVDRIAALPNFPLPIPSDPADPRSAFIPIIADIVNFEFALFTAQLSVPGVGRLDAGRARGGPEKLSQMPTPTPGAGGRFDLFDAWKDDKNPRRRQIYRGQEVFNNRNGDPNTGPRCMGCHNSPNNGTNVDSRLFNIGTASVDASIPGLTVHTFQRKLPAGQMPGPNDIVMLTDAGQGNVNGRFDDLGKFKTPTIRGLAARAPYFHNGIAETLEDVVRHYERFLNFQFTHRERDDLVAFLNAL